MTYRILIGLLLALPWASPQAAVERRVLENEHLRMELTPAIGGRVLHLSLPGRENLFKTDEVEIARRPAPKIDLKGNNIAYFGHEVWLGPQSAWWTQQAVNPERREAHAVWPPDPYLVLAPYDLTGAAEDHLVLRGPASPVSGVALTKRFHLLPDKPHTLVAEVEARNITQQPLAWGLWFNTRVHTDTWVYVPVAAADDVRLTKFPDANAAPPAFDLTNGLLHLSLSAPDKPLTSRHGKLFIHPSAGWMAGFRGGQLLLIHFDLQPRARIHPEQGQIELYHHYFPAELGKGILEMEVHFPYGTFYPEIEGYPDIEGYPGIAGKSAMSYRAREYWTVLPYTGEDSPAAHRAFLCKVLPELALDDSMCRTL